MKPDGLLKIFFVGAFFLALLLLQTRYYMSNRYADMAEDFFDQHEYTLSFEAAKSALQLSIHNTRAYVVMAKFNLLAYESTLKDDYFHTAFVAIRDAVHNSPYQSFYYDLAGQIYLAHRDFKEAARMYRIALSLYPHYLYFYNMLAYVDYIRGNKGAALSVLSDSEKLIDDYLYVSHPDDIDILHGLFLKSCILYETGDKRKALHPLTHILDLVDDGIPLNNPARRDKRIVPPSYIRAMALHDMGIIYGVLDNKAEAREYLGNAVVLNPQLKGRNDFYMIFSVCKPPPSKQLP